MSDSTTTKNAPLPAIGTRVRVHRNLHNGLWSVTDLKTRRVVCHTAAISLSDAAPKVSAATMRTIRAKNRRRVGAWIEGTITALPADLTAGTPLTFNPCRGDDFTTPSGQAWSGGGQVSFTAAHGCAFLR